jgi:hypothetical protein
MQVELEKVKEGAVKKDPEKQMEAKKEDVLNLRKLIKEVQHAAEDEWDGVQQLAIQMRRLLSGTNEEV